MSSPPPSKRHRAASTDENLPLTVKRSSDLWLSDGTIILRTSDHASNVQTLFRVHKSTLALHSTFFRDLFDGPQTAFDTASERYDDLPVMDMADDPKDVDDFLKAMYFPRYTSRHLGSTLQDLDKSAFPGMYGGILRLCQKYDAPDIRGLVVDAIRKEWPENLSIWDLRRQELDIARDGVEGNELAAITPKDVYPSPAQAIRLAMDFDIPEILPVAFYDLACHFMASPRESGHNSVTLLAPLSSNELQKLIVGMSALRDNLQNITSMNDGHDSCQELIKDWWATMHTQLYTDPDYIRLLFERASGIGSHVGLRNVCSHCAGRLSTSLASKAVNTWAELPWFFDLKGIVGDHWGT
ncbi:hypothetical protein OF83DRAFT_1133649 [Amylostereum chailletii]|nr:hypothetical protein OF83DRAFT_1133649 [Amylostereum chailletii]